MQAGCRLSSNSAAVTITFPNAYNFAPLVFLTVINSAANIPTLNSNPTTTSFEFVVWTTAGALTAQTVLWFAIGQ